MTNDEISKLKKELDEVRKQSDDRLNSWKRSAADFENYKKRRAKEDQELVMFAKEMSVLKLLPTIESLEAALLHAPDVEEHKEWHEGVKKIVKELDKVLKELGVEKIKTVGEKFDHSLHEAVEMKEGEGNSGEIFEEVAAGFKINGKVIRPAKVRVAK
ncbi:MAG: nucleotide exchange factor GrpE [Candidatus Doudnabacteria bacterium CG10_big_fil_rev_8_21_14_0_10_41_10]|uniref:Protein GrpE n=1 Tax=Candidatus Doudnabacteria bacterium CG10_big_fil_rev_8_21_14_0_10_41_10 TaxID=1974551 RepID=A0A2H0VEL2_9BACT|nr:MAG: nucleotide exchange factor GrpE [Candidatus Doudnabacteria bacterium CG10_big_fil_rev_8_21_14_0_10_41_10]